jgi:RNA polymerase sigma factor (sigma-70 family)
MTRGRAQVWARPRAAFGVAADMAAHPHSGPKSPIARGRLSAEASRFYEAVYSSARKGSLHELRRRGCSEEEAEDFFSTAYAKVMASVDPVDRRFSEPEMVNFIKLAAKRVMLDERRRQGQRPEVELSAIPSLSDAGAESPDEVAVDREAIAMGREALQMLSDRDRLIFRQRHQMDLSPEEILERTPGLSLRTYRKIIQRANGRVMAAYQRIEGGERCEEMEAGLLRRYVAEECEEAERLAVEVHLAHCRACQMAQARMRGYLLDVASGLAIAATSTTSYRFGVLAWPARLFDAATSGANGAVEAGRVAGGRIRDFAVRVVGSLPGAGGDATVGQAIGATSVKVASACAAGVAAGACVAAGVVPGIGGIGLLESHGHHHVQPHRSISRIHHASAPPTLIDRLPTESTATPSKPQASTEARKSQRASENHVGSTAPAPSSSADSVSSSPSSAKESSKVTSGEFGAESGQPVTPPSNSSPSPSPPASSSPSSGSGSGTSQGGSSSSKSNEEFGM